jgi:hypothetical protein
MEETITAKSTVWAEVNAQGDLIIPRETAARSIIARPTR